MRKCLSALLAALAFIPGCAPEGTGDLDVQWTVGLTGSCAQANLGFVAARLETLSGTLLARRDAPCDAHAVRFRDLPVGSYRVRLSAFDGDGVEAYAATVSDLSVQEGIEAASCLARLTPRPGTISLSWYFQGGRLCSAYGVEDVLLSLFSADIEILAQSFRCDRGAAVLEGLLPGSYEVRLDAVDAWGVPSHSFAAGNLLLRPGHELSFDAELTPCQGPCW